jgi:hypothetical protein
MAWLAARLLNPDNKFWWEGSFDAATVSMGFVPNPIQSHGVGGDKRRAFGEGAPFQRP